MLCGSKKYPVRESILQHAEAIVEYVYECLDWYDELPPKSRAQRDDRLHTAADHTSYPFSTQNQKDYENLLSVYLDATFNPLLKELGTSCACGFSIFGASPQRISLARSLSSDFHQEGFRYDVDDAHRINPRTEHVGIHGIVYNEMKGAMVSIFDRRFGGSTDRMTRNSRRRRKQSDPQTVAQQELESALFPTTTYRHNSGGAMCRCYYSFCGVFTGLAMPKKITTPCPPQRVESASVAPG